MAFQFLCPQGHLLQGEESQVGQPCQCPICQVQFLVPSPIPAAGQAPSPGPAPQPPPEPPGFDAVPSFHADQGQLPQVGLPSRQVAAGEVRTLLNVPGAEKPVVHIVCPSGHTLETPREMLGEDAMCPYCQVAFRLRWEDSLEYRQAKDEEQAIREQRLGKAWLQWSIAIAVVVVLGLAVLIFASTH